jgi:hypothetical protein
VVVAEAALVVSAAEAAAVAEAVVAGNNVLDNYLYLCLN